MREPKDEEKALCRRSFGADPSVLRRYFEEAEQEKAKAATWWSGCDPKEDPDVRQWSRSVGTLSCKLDRSRPHPRRCRATPTRSPSVLGTGFRANCIP